MKMKLLLIMPFFIFSLGEWQHYTQTTNLNSNIISLNLVFKLTT
jgi:hypothetical protein